MAPESLQPETVGSRAPGLSAAPSQESALPDGSWAPDVRARLEQLLRAHGRPDVPLGQRPVAVLDFDGTCVRNDLGEAVLLEAIDRRALVTNEAFLATLPEDTSRAELRVAAERTALLPADLRLDELEEQAPFLALRKGLVGIYGALQARGEPAAAVAWLARTLVGLRPDDVRALTEDALERTQCAPLAERRLALGPYDEDPIVVPSGVHYHAEVRALVAALQRHGFDVWIVSASNQWTVEVGAQRLGIAPHHVIGVQLAQDADGRLLPEVLEPLPWGPGKVDAVRTFIGRPPALVVGDGAGDREMLRLATTLAVVIDPDEETRAVANDEGWAIQPRFAPGP